MSDNFKSVTVLCIGLYLGIIFKGVYDYLVYPEPEVTSIIQVVTPTPVSGTSGPDLSKCPPARELTEAINAYHIELSSTDRPQDVRSKALTMAWIRINPTSIYTIIKGVEGYNRIAPLYKLCTGLQPPELNISQ